MAENNQNTNFYQVKFTVKVNRKSSRVFSGIALKSNSEAAINSSKMLIEKTLKKQFKDFDIKLLSCVKLTSDFIV